MANSLKKYTDLIDKSYLRIYDLVKKTDLNTAFTLSKKYNNNIYLKREDTQDVHSFKIRGAYNKMLNITDKDKPIYTCSAGNHAQGVALAGKHLNFTTNIVMPLQTPKIKVDNVRNYGGNVILYGDNFDEAKKKCNELSNQNNGIIVKPFDDEYVIAGQGTIAKELLEQLDNIDIIFCPIGGGGLVSGILSYVKSKNKEIKVIGVQTYDSNSMYKSIATNKKYILDEVGLFSDGTAVKEVGYLNYQICHKYLDDIILVDTDDLCLAIKDIYNECRAIMEPAGALSTAGLKKYVEKYNINNKNLVAILSGANMDFNKLRFISDRASIKTCNEVLLSITIPEKPGSFIKMYNQIYPRNVLEFSYRYSNNNMANVFISFSIDTINDLNRVIHNLKDNIEDCEIIDIKDNELAKTHLRFFSGGRSYTNPKNITEKIFRFEFPEKPGALKKFLEHLQTNWNVSLFHYRNYGDDIGRVLAAIQIPMDEEQKLKEYLDKLDYPNINENNNPLYKKFLV
jgi:threonine dehydratase